MDRPSILDDTAAQTRHRIVRYAALLISILLAASAALAQSMIYTGTSRVTPEPYHTSALTGEDWVIELLCGHPGRIHASLGVSHHIFSTLLAVDEVDGRLNRYY
ncbi:hypothetical protein BD779DRAFT_1493706 [Infundibulicybe gibba]|nr:hypothetical protein BD779DRAFT_1493706 [Infundibulicybe gibba]